MNTERRTFNSAATRTISIAFFAFICLGLANGLLGLAWPSIRAEFGLPLDAVNILFVVQTIAFMLVSFLIGRMMARFGSGVTLMVGTIVLSLCMFGIALSASWAMIVALALLFGTGTGILDAGLNMYAATYHDARQMNWLHACFGIGITIVPLIMNFALKQPSGWRLGYAIVGAIVLVAVVLLGITRHQWHNEGLRTAEDKPVDRASFIESLRVPVVWLSMATFIAYVGIEIGVNQWAYTVMTESRAFDPVVAGTWLSIYGAVFTGGRILFGVAAARFSIHQILRACMIAIIGGAILFWWNPAVWVGVLGLLILGVAQAPIFPMLMSGTAQRVGAINAENGISLQMASAGVGTAILPGLIGTIGRNFGLEAIPLTFTILTVVGFGTYGLTRLRRADRPMAHAAGD